MDPNMESNQLLFIILLYLIYFMMIVKKLYMVHSWPVGEILVDSSKWNVFAYLFLYNYGVTNIYIKLFLL